MTHTAAWLRSGWQMFTAKENFWRFVLLAFIYTAVMMIAGFTGIGGFLLWGPLMAAIYLVILHLMSTDRLDVNKLQEGFQFFVPAMLAGLLVNIFISATLFLCYGVLITFFSIFLNQIDGGTAFSFFSLLLFLITTSLSILITLVPTSIITALYLFPLLLIVDRKMSFWEAMEKSRKKVQADLFGFFGFTLATIGINLLGTLACGVGLLVSAPVTWCAIAVAYRELWPEEKQAALSQPTEA
ncbi:MAG: hypothetical protein GTO55_10655 [Armatimonadetes bacterium]|nr:hypothetical protein [Armatimonadota bacterium]NIM24692.1 hypothetical protein [Armatimonadota bacterium]NIM68572.1 hypothetical protein [Armatimonadota bacterium]NIM77089.1 hypothetical protein [Armatimonadota bacterium]NIN06766.1 hypothetical protein [Armatimonadota bacterium]